MIETCNVAMLVIIITFSVRCQGMCTWTVLVYSIYKVCQQMLNGNTNAGHNDNVFLQMLRVTVLNGICSNGMRYTPISFLI